MNMHPDPSSSNHRLDAALDSLRAILYTPDIRLSQFSDITMGSCIHCFSHCCDQLPGKSNVREERFTGLMV